MSPVPEAFAAFAGGAAPEHGERSAETRGCTEGLRGPSVTGSEMQAHGPDRLTGVQTVQATGTDKPSNTDASREQKACDFYKHGGRKKTVTVRRYNKPRLSPESSGTTALWPWNGDTTQTDVDERRQRPPRQPVPGPSPRASAPSSGDPRLLATAAVARGLGAKAKTPPACDRHGRTNPL